MANSSPRVKCLLLPLEGDILVIPHSLVAEIVAFQKVHPVEAGPDWLIGRVEWRGHQLPLISFESACGRPPGEVGRKVQFVVVKPLADHPGFGFYAIRIHGIPRFELIDSSNITASVQPAQECEYVASRVYVNGMSGFIPGLDDLETLLDGLPVD